MIDILMIEQLSEENISQFLVSVFDTTLKRIKVFSLDVFSKLGSKDFSGIDCLCIYSRVDGDAAQLLQFYRYEMPETEMIDALCRACEKHCLACFVPKDEYDNWLWIKADCSIETVKIYEFQDGEIPKFLCQ